MLYECMPVCDEGALRDEGNRYMQCRINHQASVGNCLWAPRL